jgi:hypothetical protein
VKKINIIFMLFAIFSIFIMDCAFAGKKNGKNSFNTNLAGKNVKSRIVADDRRKVGKNNLEQSIRNKNKPSFHFNPNFNFKANSFLPCALLCLLIADQLMLVDTPTINTTPDQKSALSIDANIVNIGSTTRKEPMLMIAEPIPHNAKSKLYHQLDEAYYAPQHCNLKTARANKNLCHKINEKFKKKPALNKILVDINNDEKFSVVSESFYKIANSGYLATAGISKCVSVSIFNPETKSSVIAHISGENIKDIDNNLSSKDNKDYLSGFQEFIGLIAGNTDLSLLEVTLLSGDQSHIEYCSEFMKQFGFNELNILYNKNWDYCEISNRNNDCSEVDGGSLAIECNTGKIYAISNHEKVRKKMKPANRTKPKRLSLETN